MSQHDYVIENASGATLRADLNAALEAAATTNKGTARPGTPYPGQLWVDENTPTATVWTLYQFDGTDDIPLGRVDTASNRFLPFGLGGGQCRLFRSGANLVLLPQDGNLLPIAGAPEVVPSGGVGLAATGLAASTTYYIYACVTGGAMALEASTTGHALDATTGSRVKSGDATRALVGMARTAAAAAWATAPALCLSWFNRRAIDFAVGSVSGSVSATGPTELNTAARAPFLTWGDEAVQATVSAVAANTNPSGVSYLFGNLDGTTQFTPTGQFIGPTAAQPGFLSPSGVGTLSEGYHFVTPYAYVSGGATNYTQVAVGGTARG